MATLFLQMELKTPESNLNLTLYKHTANTFGDIEQIVTSIRGQTLELYDTDGVMIGVTAIISNIAFSPLMQYFITERAAEFITSVSKRDAILVTNRRYNNPEDPLPFRRNIDLHDRFWRTAALVKELKEINKEIRFCPGLNRQLGDGGSSWLLTQKGAWAELKQHLDEVIATKDLNEDLNIVFVHDAPILGLRNIYTKIKHFYTDVMRDIIPNQFDNGLTHLFRHFKSLSGNASLSRGLFGEGKFLYDVSDYLVRKHNVSPEKIKIHVIKVNAVTQSLDLLAKNMTGQYKDSRINALIKQLTTEA